MCAEFIGGGERFFSACGGKTPLDFKATTSNRTEILITNKVNLNVHELHAHTRHSDVSNRTLQRAMYGPGAAFVVPRARIILSVSALRYSHTLAKTDTDNLQILIRTTTKEGLGITTSASDVMLLLKKLH